MWVKRGSSVPLGISRSQSCGCICGSCAAREKASCTHQDLSAGATQFSSKSFPLPSVSSSVLLLMACLSRRTACPSLLCSHWVPRKSFQRVSPVCKSLLSFLSYLMSHWLKANHIAKLTAEEGQECESLLGQYPEGHQSTTQLSQNLLPTLPIAARHLLLNVL